MEFDDDNYEIIISKKSQFFEPIITVSTLNKLRKYFRSSLVYELIWEKNIDYRMTETETQNFEKINILNLCRKYFSKKIRMIFK